MGFLRKLVVLGGIAASIYFGVNTGVGAAESAGGKTLLSIILVAIGLTLTGLVWAAIAVAEGGAPGKRTPTLVATREKGSFFFGALFLIGDFGAAPIHTRPAVLYGLTAGALVVILRSYGPFPDAVPPAILAVNALVYILRRTNSLARLKPQTAAQA